MAAAFTYTQTKQGIPIGGGIRISWGTYASTGGGTGGAIKTGGTKVIIFIPSPTTADAATPAWSASGGTVTLTTSANGTGSWLALTEG